MRDLSCLETDVTSSLMKVLFSFIEGSDESVFSLRSKDRVEAIEYTGVSITIKTCNVAFINKILVSLSSRASEVNIGAQR